MTYKDGGVILLTTEGALTQGEWERLLQYVTDVLRPGPCAGKQKSECICGPGVKQYHLSACPKYIEKR